MLITKLKKEGDLMKFKNVYFINGTAYAGKSTMEETLSMVEKALKLH